MVPIREGRDDDHRRKACRRAQPRGKHRGDRLESVCGPMHRLRLHGVAVVRWANWRISAAGNVQDGLLRTGAEGRRMKTNKETYYDANEDAAAWEMSQPGHRIVYARKGRSRNVYGITTLGPLVSCDDCDRSFSSKTGPDYLPEIVHAVIGDVRRGR